MTEQALNTIYVLGEQPDALCSLIISDLAVRVFGQKAAAPATTREPDLAESAPVETGEMGNTSNALSSQEDRQATLEPPSATPAAEDPQFANSFQLAQLIFAAGHISVKHLLHLELLEREFKRRKVETDKKEGSKAANSDELDHVVGSVEDDIADIVAHAKEKELMYGPESLLAIFGPMSVAICSQPKLYKVRRPSKEII